MAIQEYIQYFDDETVSHQLVAVDLTRYVAAPNEELIPFPKSEYPDRHPEHWQRDLITGELSLVPVDIPIQPDLQGLRADIESDSRLSPVAIEALLEFEQKLPTLGADISRLRGFWYAFKIDSDRFKWLTPKVAAIVENYAIARNLPLVDEAPDVNTVPDIDAFSASVVLAPATIQYLDDMSTALEKLRLYISNPNYAVMIPTYWSHIKVKYGLDSSYISFVEARAAASNIPLVN